MVGLISRGAISSVEDGLQAESSINKKMPILKTRIVYLFFVDKFDLYYTIYPD
jgi:hypothetical protein